MTRVFGVMGYPVIHSLSPIMHNAAFRALGLDAIYSSFDVPPCELGMVFRGLQASDIEGLNITVPHKERMLRYLNKSRTLDESALQVGAVNTLVRANGRFVGHNTDVAGFRRTLDEELRMDCANRRVLVLGAGGAARAVVWALLADRPQVIYVANRTLAKAQNLARRFQRHQWASLIEAIPFTPRVVASYLQNVDLLVNATSLGLRPNDPLPVDVAAIHKHLVVFDLVYRSPSTALVEAARRRGALAVDGLSMLVYQGAESFKLWFHRRPPIDVMRREVEQALRQGSP